MAKDTEQRAVDTMLHKGVEISIPKRSFLKYVGKKERVFLLTQSYLGTLYEISRVALKLDYDEKLISESAMSESKILAEKHVKNMSLIIAIAILNSKYKIWLFKHLFAKYLLWRMTPQLLAQLSILVMQMNNISDFINSIRLNSGVRLATPKNLSPEDNGG